MYVPDGLRLPDITRERTGLCLPTTQRETIKLVVKEPQLHPPAAFVDFALDLSEAYPSWNAPLAEVLARVNALDAAKLVLERPATDREDPHTIIAAWHLALSGYEIDLPVPVLQPNSIDGFNNLNLHATNGLIERLLEHDAGTVPVTDRYHQLVAAFSAQGSSGDHLLPIELPLLARLTSSDEITAMVAAIWESRAQEPAWWTFDLPDLVDTLITLHIVI